MNDPVNLAITQFITAAEYKQDRDRIRDDPEAVDEVFEKYKDANPELYKALKDDPTLAEQIVEQLEEGSISGDDFEVELDDNMMQQLGSTVS